MYMKKIKHKIYGTINGFLGVVSLTVLTGGLVSGNERVVLTGFLILIAERLADVFA